MTKLEWTKKRDFGPSPRSQHTLTYDPVRKRCVLFGGAGDTVELADTWVWDGRFWTQVSDMGPSPRRSAASAWDPSTQRVLLFGGATTAGGTLAPLGDTWAWDGQLWTQVDDSGPAARFAAALSGDTTRQRNVLFGGATTIPDVAALGDTWEWDGQQWTLIDQSGPTSRSGHSMTFDAARSRTILFGGIALDGTSDTTTWLWDGTSWARGAHSGPSGRLGTALAADQARAVLFSGTAQLSPSPQAPLAADTWEWDGQQWALRRDFGPEGRHTHALAYDSARDRYVLFGGVVTSGALMADTWELNPRTA